MENGGGQVGVKVRILRLKIPLPHLQRFLVATNFMIFGAAITLTQVARNAKRLGQFKLQQVNMLKGNPIGQTETYKEELVEHTVKGIELVLYITSSGMLLYWIVCGVAIPLNFGRPKAICIMVIATTYTMLMVIWEIGLLAYFAKMASENQLDGFYIAWSNTLTFIVTSSCIIQSQNILLSFLIYRSLKKEERQLLRDPQTSTSWHTNMNTSTPVNMNASINDNGGNSEYVEFDPYHTPLSFLYHTNCVRLSEMPDQILKYRRPVPETRIYMNKTLQTEEQFDPSITRKIYNANDSWRAISRNDTIQTGSKNILPEIFNTYDKNDYMEMKVAPRKQL